MKHNLLALVSDFFEKYFPDNAEELSNSFEKTFLELVEDKETADATEVEGLRNLITSFKPALSLTMDPCEEFDMLMTMVLSSLRASWEGAHRRRAKSEATAKGPILPGSDQSLDLEFYCPICKQVVDVPHDKKLEILNSDEQVELPRHCGQELNIRITKLQESSEEPVVNDEKIEPIEMLMQYIPAENVEYMKVLSVGIDVGSSTSHLIFSRLTLKRETSMFNMTNRFNLVNREILYESDIIFTPLLDRYTLDIDEVVAFCKDEYRKAGITPEMVETGAVLVTGESAKKQNAADIVKRLSSESGRFVSAAAGPNLESLLGAMGSGIVERSIYSGKCHLHVDIGGGTSNCSIIVNGQVLSTSCINVGGRLLGIDQDCKIWRVDGPTQFLMNELGMSYKVGDEIQQDDARAIAREYAKALIEVMQGPARSVIARELMMTEDLDFSNTVDVYSFSGGVAEFLYGGTGDFQDIGFMLAEEISDLLEEYKMNVEKPVNLIRATVIGAGAFSMSVSGSTTFFDKNIDLPVVNVPVLPVLLADSEFTPERLVESIAHAYRTFDMTEGEDIAALYFRDPVVSRYYSGDEWLVPFAKAIETALPETLSRGGPIILVFGYDVAKRLGLAMRDSTSIKSNVLVLDELSLEAGDWIDIGSPLGSSESFPVTVKSLVFNENKEYS
jgi:ethanolamine utilization protein EutA